MTKGTTELKQERVGNAGTLARKQSSADLKWQSALAVGITRALSQYRRLAPQNSTGMTRKMLDMG